MSVSNASEICTSFPDISGCNIADKYYVGEKSFSSAREHYIGELRRGLDTCNPKKKTYIESFFDEIEPLFKDFSGRCAAVWEGKLCHGHPRLLEVVRLVCRVSGAN